MTLTQNDYLYAVSRVRCKEKYLLTNNQLQQMVSMNNVNEIVRFLKDRGWQGDLGQNLCEKEEAALWGFIDELVGNMSCLDFLRVSRDFYNLKVCVKSFFANTNPRLLFRYHGLTEPELIYRSINEKNFSVLPAYLQNVAECSMSVLEQTSDGQLCDVLIDKACLENVYLIGKKSRDYAVKSYCEIFVAISDIKIAVRGAYTLKPKEFFYNSLAECNSLDIDKLAAAGIKGIDEVMSYLKTTEYKNALPYLCNSISEFEKWSDNFIMSKMREYGRDTFSIAPLVAYVFAKESEIKAVRFILTAKLNGIDESVVRENLRDMYV